MILFGIGNVIYFLGCLLITDDYKRSMTEGNIPSYILLYSAYFILNFCHRISKFDPAGNRKIIL